MKADSTLTSGDHFVRDDDDDDWYDGRNCCCQCQTMVLTAFHSFRMQRTRQCYTGQWTMDGQSVTKEGEIFDEESEVRYELRHEQKTTHSSTDGHQ